jgi:chromosome segregation ATPase
MAHLIDLAGRQSPVTQFLKEHASLSEQDEAFEPTRSLFRKFEDQVLAKHTQDSDSALSSASERIRDSLEHSFSQRFHAIERESEEEIGTLQGKVATLETASQLLKHSKAKLEHQVSELEQTLILKQHEHASALAEASKSHKQEMESLTGENTELSKCLSAATERNASFEEAIQLLQENLALTLAGAQADKANAEVDKARLIQEHKAALTSSSSANADLQRQVQDLQGESGTLEEKFRHLEAQLAQTQQMLEESKLALAQAKTVTTADKIKAYAPVVVATFVAALGAAATLL